MILQPFGIRNRTRIFPSEIVVGGAVELTIDIGDNALALADSEIVNLGYEIPKTEDLDNLVDSLLLKYSYIILPTDDLDNLSDSISKVISYETSFVDNLDNLNDALLKILGYHILSIDILTQSDSIIKRLGYLITKSDNILNLSDTAIINLIHKLTLDLSDDASVLTDSLDNISLTGPGEDQNIIIRLII